MSTLRYVQIVIQVPDSLKHLAKFERFEKALVRCVLDFADLAGFELVSAESGSVQ